MKNIVAVEDKVKVEETLPVYEVPTVTTYTDEAILEELGPAQANTYEVDNPFEGSKF
ncbi:hypothetical protein QUF58_01730 [Anaerolineales bacterium HSG24]|nr:hypothetical protein [Anaerolineales bacterium HSG24]